MPTVPSYSYVVPARAITGTALAPEQAARDSHARTHARTHTPPPHTQLLLLAPLVQLAA
eukprot:COSAG01_NODE_2043_length_8564_cov_76.365859_4_plen_59_part_00